jgi:hypothetical protein
MAEHETATLIVSDRATLRTEISSAVISLSNSIQGGVTRMEDFANGGQLKLTQSFVERFETLNGASLQLTQLSPYPTISELLGRLQWLESLSD